MKERNRAFVVPVHITIKAYGPEDAVKRCQEGVADGLIEPGFALDALVSEGPLVELEPLEKQ